MTAWFEAWFLLIREAEIRDHNDWLGIATGDTRIASASLFLSIIIGLTLLTVVRIWQGRTGRAFWCVTSLVAVTCIMTGGIHDVRFHIYRVATLAQQFAEGTPSLFVTNEISGDVLPVFVFYSSFPYTIPVLLDLVGLGATMAYRITLAASFILFATGILRLTLERATTTGTTAAAEGSLLSAIMLLSCSYITGVWIVRSAFAEVVVLCLLPWAILALRTGGWRLAIILAAQIASHPIVFPQMYFCLIVFGLAVCGIQIKILMYRLAWPTFTALMLSAAFWAPPVLWKSAILGGAGLTVRFEDTFLSLAALLNPLDFRTIGIWIPLALLALIVCRRGFLSWRGGVLATAFVTVTALQTELFEAAAPILPHLRTGLFVWRLMSTSALLAFGLLLLDMSALSWRLIRVLCCGAVVNMAIFIAAQTGFRAGQVFAIVPDAAYRVAAAQENPVWGVAEFHPDYASLPDICALPAPEEMLHVPFSEARAGITVHTAFIGLRRAPIRFVSYKLDGVPIIFSGKCGDLLVFGPFEHSGNFIVDESIVQALLGLRLLATLVIFAGAGALILSAWARRLVVAREKGPPHEWGPEHS